MNACSEGEQYKSGGNPAMEMCVEDAIANPVTFCLARFYTRKGASHSIDIERISQLW